jgi:DNA ligase-1
MLSAKLPENVTPEQLRELVPFPVLATPKFDGIRCERIDDIVRSGRNFKELANNYIYTQIESKCEGELDGEIITFTDGKQDEFNEIQSKVMSHNGEPDFKFMVFDIITKDLNRIYTERTFIDLQEHNLPSFCEKIIPVWIHNVEELLDYELQCITRNPAREGHEGVMLRIPQSPYKCGRSTLNQFWLVKLVRYAESEAIVLDIYEQMQNMNEATTSSVGYTVRRKTKDAREGKGIMGSMLVRDIKTDMEFKVGCAKGMQNNLRAHIWENADEFLGKMITYKYKPYGMKDKPRHPVFKGFRYDLI